MWDDDNVSKEKQCEAIRTLGRMWFKATRDIALDHDSYASIAYGEIRSINNSHLGKLYTGEALSKAVKLGCSIFYDNQLSGHGLILSDKLSSEQLFHQKPSQIFEKSEHAFEMHLRHSFMTTIA